MTGPCPGVAAGFVSLVAMPFFPAQTRVSGSFQLPGLPGRLESAWINKGEMISKVPDFRRRSLGDPQVSGEQCRAIPAAAGTFSGAEDTTSTAAALSQGREIQTEPSDTQAAATRGQVCTCLSFLIMANSPISSWFNGEGALAPASRILPARHVHAKSAGLAPSQPTGRPQTTIEGASRRWGPLLPRPVSVVAVLPTSGLVPISLRGRGLLPGQLAVSLGPSFFQLPILRPAALPG